VLFDKPDEVFETLDWRIRVKCKEVPDLVPKSVDCDGSVLILRGVLAGTDV